MSERKVNIWFALVLGWLVPGLGHFYAKRKLHGLFYFVMIAGLYGAGLIVSGGTAVNATDHLAYFVCQILAGPITFGIEALRNPDSLSLGHGMSIMAHQTGTVYAATAGVLNLIAICELYRRHVNPEEPGPADTMRVDAINAEREAS
ncbi:MAG: hypothetical protein KDB82_02525 [Planctomycetes bacterium]|nr:hypothetical protein [Planctomycetota bacterium]